MKEFYGSVKKMPDDILEERLQQAVKDTNELAAEKRRREQFTEAEKLADKLHGLLHYHIDCDYDYSDWPNPTGCRSRFLIAATQFISSGSDLDKIIDKLIYTKGH